MKNKLWAFGDSYTAGILPDIDHFPPYKEYLKYLGIKKEDFPEGWPKKLSDKLNMDLSVVAVGGTSNEETILNLYNKIPDFTKNDIVIIQWSYMNRFLWANSPENYNFDNITGNPYGMFKRASIHTQSDKHYEFAPTEVFKQVGVNKSLTAWTLQVHSFEKLINHISNIVGFKVFFWSTDDIIHLSKSTLLESSQYLLGKLVKEYSDKNPNKTNKYLESIRELGATSIYQETDGNVDDEYHLGINGNEVLSNLFYNHIKKYLYN